MNTMLTIAYNGGAYHGFQVQQNATSVCAVLQDAMQAVLGARPDVKGCSRTDAGVHARGFCLNFRYEHGLPMEKLPLALNDHLPPDIRVLAARRVPEAFHARYDCAGKEYRYIIRNHPVDDVFRPGQYYRVARPLDTAVMNRAAAHLVGYYDFKSFQSAGSKAGDTRRTLHTLRVEREAEWVTLVVAADGFLYNMVRILAGTLLAVGTGALAPGDMPAILAARDRAAAGDTLPARGLFLWQAFYPSASLEDITV